MKRIIKIALALAPCIAIGLFGHDVVAIKSLEELYKLSLLQGVEVCYEEYAKESVEAAAFVNYESIFYTDGGFSKTASKDVWITTHIGNNLSGSDLADSNLSCKQVFEGYNNKAKGIKDYYQIPNTLEGLGYVLGDTQSEEGQAGGATESDSDKVVFSIGLIKDASGNNANPITSSGAITCSAEQVFYKGGLFSSDEYVWELTACNGEITGSYRGEDIYKISFSNNLVPDYESDPYRDLFWHYDYYQLNLGSGDEVELTEAFYKSQFYETLERFVKSVVFDYYGDPVVEAEVALATSENDESGLGVFYKLIGDNSSLASGVMLQNLNVSTDYSSWGNGISYVHYVWDNEWIYSLYYRYLINTINKHNSGEIEANKITINNCSSEKPESGWAFRNSSSEWCSINFSGTSGAVLNNDLSIVVSSNRLGAGKFGDILTWFGDENSYIGISEDSYANESIAENGDLQPVAPSETTEDSENKQDECYANSGSLGWIMCPIITAAQGVGEFMWEEILEKHLELPASEIFASDGGVWDGWSTMQNIANILFIILFLVVIFSQLTGMGIDNYGVKKILPRLIVIAILVNLSYLICQIAIDLSNIFGMGLNNMFSGWAGDIGSGAEASGGAQAGSWALTSVLGVAGLGLYGILQGGTLLGAAAAIGLLILGLVITIVVAILTLYLILTVREAGVVLAVIIAPVAIVCYALPNTEKLSKKWFDLFKALLVVYPICGAMVGAGQLAGAVLSRIDSPSMKFAAMIVQVLPFFLVPTLLRSSLSMMGNVGARLSTLGRSFGRRGSRTVTGAVRNSERFKDFSQSQREAAAERRARRTREGVNIFGRRVGGLANRNPNALSERQRDRLRKADDVLLAQRKQREENRLRTQGGYYDAMVNKQDLSIESETDAIARLNDPTVLAAERSSLADKARLERSKARTILLSDRYRNEGLEQLQVRWNIAFDSNDEDELDALTNVMTQRYGTSAANSIANRLGEVDIVGNTNRQNSMRTLQRTMNDNSAFAGNMRSKTPDAFQMISEAGTRYDAATGRTSFENLNYFSRNNTIATQVKDWATASGATLQRAVDSGAISERQLEELLNSDDPSIRSGLQSEDGKREILEAALYNRRHNSSGVGPNLDNATASARYQAEKDAQRVAQEAAERTARRTDYEAAQQVANNRRVIEVRRYKPKIVGAGMSNHTIKVMGDGRMIDEQGNEFTDIDLYDRSD